MQHAEMLVVDVPRIIIEWRYDVGLSLSPPRKSTLLTTGIAV